MNAFDIPLRKSPCSTEGDLHVVRRDTSVLYGGIPPCYTEGSLRVIRRSTSMLCVDTLIRYAYMYLYVMRRIAEGLKEAN
jgi:hypothetical protein